jgi:DNA mismatch repair protein MutL
MIRILPDHVANQIAAGEVVERPVSIVRELIDNSVDAGAKSIFITLEQGGKGLIRVNDDGCGMNKDDALLAFDRHATSKISKAEDLADIKTLGFRGEALPSIASVAEVMLRTKRLEDSIGTEVLISFGKLKNVVGIGCNHGSEFSIAKLFSNVPARKKFLREANTEFAKIKQYVLRISVANPKVHFKLSNDSKEILNLAPRDSALLRASSLIKGNFLEFSEKGLGMFLEGVVAHPAHAEADAGAFVILVNGRLVSDRLILRAVRDGFSSMLKDREFPVGFLSLTIDPKLVDVNVHPQKSEVRFVNSQEIFRFVRLTISNAVNKFKAPMPAQFMQRNQGSNLNMTGVAPVISQTQAINLDFFRSRTTSVNQQSYSDNRALAQALIETVRPNVTETFRFSDLKYIGQIFACYLLCAYQEEFIIVDMHAAHERCNYNLFRARKTIKTQELLIPLTVEFTEHAMTCLLSRIDEIKKFGFDIEQFGETQIVVRAAPQDFSAQDIIEVLRGIAALLDEQSSLDVIEEKIDKIVARSACHASIRSGRLLEKEEVMVLFAMLDNNEISAACPHGRPITVSFSKSQVESWFGRDR